MLQMSICKMRNCMCKYLAQKKGCRNAVFTPTRERQCKLGTQLHYFSGMNKVLGFFCLFTVI